MNRRLPFQKLLHRGVGECGTPFLGLFHFTLDRHLIMLTAKQGGIKYHSLNPGLPLWMSPKTFVFQVFRCLFPRSSVFKRRLIGLSKGQILPTKHEGSWLLFNHSKKGLFLKTVSPALKNLYQFYGTRSLTVPRPSTLLSFFGRCPCAKFFFPLVA